MLERLRNLVLEALPEEGRIENPMPCLALTRFNGPQQSRQCFYHPMMTLGLGGEKESLIGARPSRRLSDPERLARATLPVALHSS